VIEHGWEAFPTTGDIVNLVIALCFMAACVVAWLQWPGNRVGLPMTVSTLLWIVHSVPVPPLAPLPFGLARWVLSGLWPAALAHLFLAYPTGRLGRMASRGWVAVAYVESALVRLVLWAENDPAHPSSWFAELVLGAEVAIVIAMAVFWLQLVKWWRGSVAERRAIGIVLAASLLATLLYAIWVPIWDLGLRSAIPWVDTVMQLSIGVVPVAYLVTLLRNRIDRARVADLLVRLNGGAPPDSLPQALAQALHDPSLSIGYWVPEQERYVDHEGRETSLPLEDPHRVVTRVDHGGAHVAVLIHDPALLRSPGLVEAVCAAAAIALENQRLTAELRARLNQLAASRGRLMKAVALERRRLERDLHDGVQQRLLSVAMTLGMAETAESGNRTLIAEAKSAVLTALDELRAVCDGIHPPVLTERGLPGAVREMTAVAPVPTEVTIHLPTPPPPEVETVTYYVVAEALTNIGKHATATRSSVSIGFSDGSLVVEVGDNGCGGADPAAGSGLRGLAERVEAGGGTFAVTSPTGQGTVIRAVLPCAS
jgi:signal transduction histidine kinase